MEPLPILRMIVAKLMRSKGMIIDCPHIWDCSTYNIVEHQRTRKSEPISLFEDSLRFHYNLKHQEKLINKCWDVFMEYCWAKNLSFLNPVFSKDLRRSWEILLPKVSRCPPVVLSRNRWFWRHKPSWGPPVALLFVLELLPIYTTDEFL